MEAEQLLTEMWALLAPVLDLAEDVVRSTARTEPLAAFLCGVVAVLVRARLLIIGAVLLAVVQSAVVLGYLPNEPVWLMPAAASFLVVGLIQGAAVTLLGDDGGNDLMVFLFVGVLAMAAFLIWRGPKGLLKRLLRRRA